MSLIEFRNNLYCSSVSINSFSIYFLTFDSYWNGEGEEVDSNAYIINKFNTHFCNSCSSQESTSTFLNSIKKTNLHYLSVISIRNIHHCQLQLISSIFKHSLGVIRNEFHHFWIFNYWPNFTFREFYCCQNDYRF